MTIPPGAFPDCEKLETPVLLRPDGKEATAFKSRAKSLAAMRLEVIALRDEVDVLKAKLAAIPFPFGSP